jgi:antitoxin CptB
MNERVNELERIRWQCRRGMLELDLVLNRFVERDLTGLAPAELETFRQLLDEPDPQLLAWVMEQETAPAPYAALVQRLRSI